MKLLADCRLYTFIDTAYLAGHALGTLQTLEVEDSPLCLHASRIAFVHPKDFLGALVELEEHASKH